MTNKPDPKLPLHQYLALGGTTEAWHKANAPKTGTSKKSKK